MTQFDRTRWEFLFDQYVATKKLKPNTIHAYELDLKSLLDWCDRSNCDPAALSYLQFQFYFHTKRKTLADSSVSRQEGTLKGFYRWLAHVKELPDDPLKTHVVAQPPTHVRPSLTVEQLRQLLHVATGDPRDYAYVSLLVINAMRTDDITNTLVMDMQERDGQEVLMIRRRRGRTDISFTPLVPETVAALREHIGLREDGPLLLARNGKAFGRKNAITAVRRLARKAELPDWVTPLTLTFAVRPIAIQYGFSYASVLRCAGEIDMRIMSEWLQFQKVDPRDHAVFRMSDLLVNRSEVDKHLHRAEQLLTSDENPPALSASLAGAALEKLLRDFVAVRDIQVSRPESMTLSAYGSLMKREGHFSEAQVQMLAAIQAIRNNAAHGWFDLVSDDDARRVIQTARSVMAHLHPR